MSSGPAPCRGGGPGVAPGQLKGFWVGDEEKPVGSAGGQWFSPCRGALAVFIANKELTSTHFSPGAQSPKIRLLASHM